MKFRRCLLAGLSLTLLWAGPVPAHAATGATAASAVDCQEHQAFVDGDAHAVQARLPRSYIAVQDAATQHPLLFVRAIRCAHFAVAGDSWPVIFASYGIVVESPDGMGCASAAPVLGAAKGDVPPVCNWYTLAWLANDARAVRWLRAGTPSLPAHHVPTLEFELGALDPARGGAPFRFRAPSPAPSTFTIEAVGRERPGKLPVRGGYWFDTPDGTIKLAFSTEDIESGDANGAVTAAPGSELATLLGAPQRTYAVGYSGVSAERWGHASYQKQNVG